MSWSSTVTNQGVSLLQQWSASGQTLVILRATAGTGSVPESNLKNQVVISGEVGEVDIVARQEVTSGVEYRIQVQPAATTGYTLCQVGLWAQLGSGGTPTLLAIYQNAEGIAIPTAAAEPGFLLTLHAVVAMSNDANVVVNFSSSSYLTRADLPLPADAVSIPLVTTTRNGLMASTDKVTLDNVVKLQDGHAFYNSFSDLDLAGPCTVADVYNAMSANSSGYFGYNENWAAGALPERADHGTVHIERHGVRGEIEFISKKMLGPADLAEGRIWIMGFQDNTPNNVWLNAYAAAPWRVATDWASAVAGASSDIRVVFEYTESGNTSIFTIEIPVVELTTAARFFYGTTHAKAGSADNLFYYQIQARTTAANYVALYKNGTAVTAGLTTRYIYR